MPRHHGEFYPALFPTEEPAAAISKRRQQLLQSTFVRSRADETPCFLVAGLPERNVVVAGTVAGMEALCAAAEEESVVVILGEHWEKHGARVSAVTW